MELKQSPMYKKPTGEQRKKIETARKKTREGMEARDDIFSKISPVMRKMARDEESEGKEMMRKVPEPVKRYEAEEGSPPMGPFKKGGSVMKYKEGGMACGGRTKKMMSGGMTSEAKPKKMMGGGMAYKKGGKIDGCAKKGKTKGRMC